MRTLKTYLRCGAPLPSLVSLSRHSRWRAGGWAGGYLVPGAAAGFSRLGCSLFCHGAHMRHENGHTTISPPWRETGGESITSYNVCLVAARSRLDQYPYPHILHVRLVWPLTDGKQRNFSGRRLVIRMPPGWWRCVHHVAAVVAGASWAWPPPYTRLAPKLSLHYPKPVPGPRHHHPHHQLATS